MQQALPFEFGIILAAGGSTRMGHPKALLDHQGEALVNAHVRAFQTHCKNIIVVTGAHDTEIQRVLAPDIYRIHNTKWQTSHMSDSLRLAIQDHQGLALVTPVDCPPAPIPVLEALTQVGNPAVCTFMGKDGHPVAIDMEITRRSVGSLREVLADAVRVPTQWPGALENWNKPNDIRAYSSEGSSDRS